LIESRIGSPNAAILSAQVQIPKHLIFGFCEHLKDELLRQSTVLQRPIIGIVTVLIDLGN
jgi:hypothetical protein